MLNPVLGLCSVGVLSLLACGSDKVSSPEARVPSDSAAGEIIISAAIPRASLPGTMDSSGSVVFVSAAPHTLDRVAQAVVSNAGGQSVPAAVQDGGFDPVSLAAVTGEVVTVSLTDSNGATTSTELTVRARRPPRVVRTSIGPQRTDVPLNVVIRVVFSAPVDLESARAGITLATAAGETVPGTVQPAGAVAVDYVVTAGTLVPETTYRLDVTTDVLDVRGEPLVEAVSLEFRTGSTAPVPPPAGVFELTIAPLNIEVDQGGSVEARVTLTRGTVRGEPFGGAVTLASVSPPGVSITFSPARIDSGSSTATVQVTVDTAVAVGPVSVEIRGTSSGPGSVTMTRRLALAVALAPPTLGLGMAPTSIQLVRGGRAERVETWIARGSSLTGDVSMGVSGQAEGIAASLSPTSIGMLSSSANLYLTAAATANVGPSTLVITAAGGNERGQTSTTRTLNVTVVEPSGSVSLAATPSALNIVANGPAAVSTIAIERTPPYSGPVSLSLAGAPPGVTGTIDPGSAAGTTATLAISARAGTRNGTYDVSVVGTDIGIATASATVSVTITGGTEPLRVSFDPSSVTVTAGGASATTAVTPRYRTMGPGGRPYLTVDRSQLPSGVTVRLDASAIMTVQADSAVVPGTYLLTVTVRQANASDPISSREIARGELPVVVLAAP